MILRVRKIGNKFLKLNLIKTTDHSLYGAFLVKFRTENKNFHEIWNFLFIYVRRSPENCELSMSTFCLKFMLTRLFEQLFKHTFRKQHLGHQSHLPQQFHQQLKNWRNKRHQPLEQLHLRRPLNLLLKSR